MAGDEVDAALGRVKRLKNSTLKRRVRRAQPHPVQLLCTVLAMGVAALTLGSAQVSASSGARVPTTPASPGQTFYFHGTASDDVNRANFSPSATFDTVAPTATTDVTQTGSVGGSPTLPGDPLSVYWLSTAYTGPISGTMHLDWWWSTANAETVVLGEDLDVTIWADVDMVNLTGSLVGQARVHIAPGPTPVESTADITGLSGSVATNLMVQASVVDADLGSGNTVHYDSTTAPSFFTLPGSGATATPTATASATATATASAGPPPPGSAVFANYTSTQPMPHPPVCDPNIACFLTGEPSLGVDWVSNETMYQGGLNTWDVHFDYSVKPPGVAWLDRSNPSTDVASLDPRLITDHTGGARATGDRTIVDQLVNGNSVQAYTDTDGGSTPPPANSGDWVASAGGGFPSGPDHQSLGSGRYHAGTVPLPAPGGYPHAIYYCSQANAGAFCSRSDTGGATYGPSVPAYNLTQCAALHGKPKVGPNGTVYLPNKDCTVAGTAAHVKGVVISTDNGVTWVVHNIPGSTTDSNQSDPDLAIGGSSGSGILYYGYRDGDHRAKISVSHDEGTTWSAPIDVGSSLNIENIQFPAVVAGDADRAAFSFIGTATAGDDAPDNFGCPPGQSLGCAATWYLYTAITTDGGLTWNTVNDTPADPVQRGGVCLSGIGCNGSDRNMLDFNDSAIDNQGRVQVAYTDGCSGACDSSPNTTSGKFSSVFSLVDQVCGVGLFASHDPGFFNGPTCPNAAVTVPEVHGVVGFVGIGLAGLGLFEVARRRRRRLPHANQEGPG